MIKRTIVVSWLLFCVKTFLAFCLFFGTSIFLLQVRAGWFPLVVKGSVIPPSFTGVFDIITTCQSGGGDTCFYWGLRCAYASICGASNKLVNACHTTTGVDDGCADLVSSASTGALVPAVVDGTHTCPGAGCNVKKIYDQGNQGNACQTASAPCNLDDGGTIANRPALTASCGPNGTACMVCNGSTDLSNTSGPALNQPFSIGTFGNRTTGTGYADIFGINPSGGVQQGATTGGGTALFYAGNVVSPAAADAAFHALHGDYNGSSSIINVDAAANVPSQNMGGVNPTAGNSWHICTGNNPFTGDVSEIYINDADKSANFVAVATNMIAFW